MKKIQYITLLLSIMLLTYGCINNSKNKVIRQIEDANKGLPVSYPGIGIFEKIVYDKDKNQVIMTFTLNDIEIFESMNKTRFRLNSI